MTLTQLKLGAEPKKVIALIVFVVIAAISYFLNRDSGGTTTTVPPPVSVAPAAAGQKVAAPSIARSSSVRVTQTGLIKASKESHPNLKPKTIDPSSIDPTLRTDLLAKLQDVKVEGITRSLFDVLAAPPAPVATEKEPDKIHPAEKAMVGPMPPKPPPPPPPDPKAPAIPLKFYGFVNPAKTSDKRAFFLDGEEIVIASEGELVKKRYKIVRIGVNSAVVEDTTFKGTNTQQTLPLEAEMNG